MTEISWGDFEKVELRVGEIIAVDEFPEARKPAWKMTIDFGAEIGMRRSSAQITDLYDAEKLIGKQVLAVVNFPPKQIGPFMSECLVTGFSNQDGAIVLAVPDQPVEKGLRLV
ncbi:MAG: tRNA-binding protein [Woeseia sp.]|nr:tRNA-binding protein [Woeseia sp.]MBT6211572.1 tRNA-binding protein [Woeseia sp.]